MITAVDTSVLIDIFRDDPDYCRMSADAIRRCIQEGRLVVCDVVWSELTALFPSRTILEEKMSQLGIDFLVMKQDSASLAGEYWRQYRLRGGSRERVIADFLIGAHATIQCDRLLTRDRGFYRDYFGQLDVVDPTGYE